MKKIAVIGTGIMGGGDCGELAGYPGGIVAAHTWQNYQNPPSPINFALQWVTKDITYAK